MRIKGKKATEFLKEISVNLKWCDRCCVPVLRASVCTICGERAREVIAVAPKDVRPAFEKDLKKIKSLLVKEYGGRIAERLLPGRSLILLNKVEYADAADEIIVGGYTIGTRIFDLGKLSWVFRPEYRGAALLIEEGKKYAVVKSDYLKKFQFIERSEIIEGDVPDEGYVAVESRSGKMQGLAKVLERGGLRIIKVWRAVSSLPEVKSYSDLKKAVKANEEKLEELESEAVELIKEYSVGSAVTASGGKDSSAVLSLAAKSGVKNVVYVDTGVDFIENKEMVEKVCNVLGLNLTVAKPVESFWKYIKVFGVQARDYRWCTRVLKLAPMAKVFSKKGWKVSITGQRKYESISRALLSPVSSSLTLHNIEKVVSPIHDWCALEVFIYLVKEGILVNPLYYQGFDRIGCYVCPMLKLPELRAVAQRSECKLWETFLRKQANKIKLPKEWVSMALWRWRYKFPPEVEAALSKRGIKAREIILKVLSSRASVGIEGSSLRIILRDIVEPNLKLIADRLSEYFQVDYREKYIVLNKQIEITNKGVIVIPIDNLRNLDLIIKTIYSESVCVKCNLCKWASPEECPVVKYLHLDSVKIVSEILGVKISK